MSTDYPQDLQEVIRFHGHICPGIVIGYRAARIALLHLQAERPEDEELVAIVESDACGVDAIQTILGCTLGKGNLIYHDYGKHVFSVICRKQNLAVRIAMKADAIQRTPRQEEMVRRVRSGEASEEDQRQYDFLQKNRIRELLTMEQEALFKIENVVIPVPAKARIFKSVICHYCGESVMGPRARIRDGEICCIPCSETYAGGLCQLA